MVNNLFQITITVPSTSDKNKAIDTAEFIDRGNAVSVFLSDLFGGSTKIIHCSGDWLDNGLLISEDVIIVQSFTPDLSEDIQDRIIAQVECWRDSWKQECVLLAILQFNGRLLFI